MARLEEAIYSILSSDASVTALVSTRIYPFFLPQECTLPAITFYRVSTDREYAFMTDPGYATVRISIDILGESASSTMSVAEVVRTALHRYKGTVAGVKIYECHIETENSIYEPETDVYRLIIDFMVSHYEL